jgi:hypothetical protein
MRYVNTIVLVSSLIVGAVPVSVASEPKVIISEGTYIMGDGETPAFAEAMALQKAKQTALEQAGTYVESYTHIKNLDVTIDEIKTIAGGLLETEVMERNRVLLKDGGERFYTQIKARITTAKIEELARQIKGGNAAGENKELLESYARIERELKAFKLQMAESRTEQEREVVLDKIRDVEKQFRQVRSSETALHKKLLSGEQLSVQLDKALRDQHRRKEEEKKRQEWQERTLSAVLEKLRGSGFAMRIGSPEVILQPLSHENVTLAFPVIIDGTDELLALMKELDKAYSQADTDSVEGEIDKILTKLYLNLSVFLKSGTEYRSGPHKLKFRSAQEYEFRQILVPQTVSSRVDVPRQFIQQVASVEGHISMQQLESRSR